MSIWFGELIFFGFNKYNIVSLDNNSNKGTYNRVLVIGSNGKVGKKVVKYLIDEGCIVKAMLRKSEQETVLKEMGAEVVIADLEQDFLEAYKGIDAVIFTAGSGSSTGPDKTISVDQEGAIKSIENAEKYGVKRYIMVSAQGAREPNIPSKIQHYYKAKSLGDNRVFVSGLKYTIFRPGRLLDDIGAGLVKVSTGTLERGETSRDALARMIAKSINMPNTYGKIIEVVNGQDIVEKALENIV